MAPSVAKRVIPLRIEGNPRLAVAGLRHGAETRARGTVDGLAASSSAEQSQGAAIDEMSAKLRAVALRFKPAIRIRGIFMVPR